MARQEVQYEGRAEALQTVAAPRISAVQARFDPRGDKGFALAEALGAAGPTIEKFEKEWEQRKTQEQAMKIDAYREQFMKDWKGGAVSQAQVKERFPETVPIIAARIAESIGAQYGKQSIQGIIDEVNKNDELRLDSGKRNAFIEQKKQELFGQIGEGNDFYRNGMVKQVEAELNQFENSWQRETAKYHNEVQAQTFSEEISRALQGNGNLEEIDAKYKSSSSLNNLERNKLVIDTATNLAFVSDDPSLLDKIPSRFLNTNTKLEIEKSKIQIQAARMAKVRDAQTLENIRRDRELREAKIGMISNVVAGKPINLADFRNNPEAFEFAKTISSADLLPKHQSQANAAKVRSAILSASSTRGLNENAEIDAIVNSPLLNPSDKEALINEIPKLLEGRIALDDPMVKNSIQFRLDPYLKSLETSTNAVVARIVSGENLRAQAMQSFDMGLRQQFAAYFESNGRWPTGLEKQKIIDAETAKAEALVQNLIKLRTAPGPNQQAPAAGQTPAAPQQNKVIDFNQLPPKR